jgi:hypothetical protein
MHLHTQVAKYDFRNQYQASWQLLSLSIYNSGFKLPAKGFPFNESYLIILPLSVLLSITFNSLICASDISQQYLVAPMHQQISSIFEIE